MRSAFVNVQTRTRTRFLAPAAMRSVLVLGRSVGVPLAIVVVLTPPSRLLVVATVGGHSERETIRAGAEKDVVSY